MITKHTYANIKNWRWLNSPLDKLFLSIQKVLKNILFTSAIRLNYSLRAKKSCKNWNSISIRLSNGFISQTRKQKIGPKLFEDTFYYDLFPVIQTKIKIIEYFFYYQPILLSSLPLYNAALTHFMDLFLSRRSMDWHLQSMLLLCEGL